MPHCHRKWYHETPLDVACKLVVAGDEIVSMMREALKCELLMIKYCSFGLEVCLLCLRGCLFVSWFKLRPLLFQ